jgi:hypothetical protein
MAAAGGVMAPLEELIAECGKTWPANLASALTKPSTAPAVALVALIEYARSGSVSTIPYARLDKGVIHWVSFGGHSRLLLEYAEDLRSWVMQGYGTKGDLQFVQSDFKGRLAHLVHNASPAGYLRWTSDAQALPAILGVLAQMHSLLGSMPDGTSALAPSLHALRFRFVSALRLGEWAVAESVVDEIDRWNLEQAHKTMQMRLRVLGQSGSHARLLEIVDKHHLWALTHPTRVAEAILEAVLHEVLQPLEATLAPFEVCEAIRPWYSKLVSVLPQVAPMSGFAHLFAYVACLDGDGPSVQALLPQLSDPVAAFIRERFGLSAESVAKLEPDSIPVASARSPTDGTDDAPASPGQTFWNTLQALVRNGTGAELNQQLSELDARVLDGADYLVHAPDALLEMISDPAVEARAASRNALQEVLTSLVDLSFSVPGFPSPKHLELYLSLAEALVYVRGGSASEEDAHLLHGLLAAIANLSSTAADRCTDLLRSWWRLRPILPRLDWLIAVLDSLAPLHPDPNSMVDMWSQAVELATRKKFVLSPSQVRTWERVAGLLELDAESVASDLASLRPSVAGNETDALSAVNWQKIAIVSLQEGAAREAARELQARTGAEVIVVTSLVQDGLTKAAQTADVILLVWAACSHAVYRAFDEHRERLVYVQGTGTSSIMTAAESWAEKRALSVL